MPRFLKATSALLLVFILSASNARAISTFLTVQGGTGTTSPSGILYGDNGATNHFNTVTIGSGLTFSGGTLSIASGGSGLATGTPWTALQLAQVKDNGTVISIATSSLGLLTTNVAEGTNLYFTNARAQGAISVSGVPLTYSSGVIGINQANGSQAGYLSSSDWTTFNNKQAALTFGYPILNTANTISLAFGTTTANTWSQLQTFNGGITTSGTVTLGSLSGVLYGSTGVVNAVATSSLAVSSSFSYSGTLGTLVGGTGGTLSIANGGVSNAMLANSTISGVSLGGSLFSHTHNATLNGTSYNGSAAVSDWGLNLGNANTWTALQQFGNASTSLLSSYGPSYFGATATSSFSTAGVLSLVNGSVGTPALNVGDAATGLFRAALNTLDWAINGVEKMTLNATGLGVGSTSPSTMLSVGTPTTPGTILSAEYQPATSTSMTIDFKNGNQQLVRTGTAATTIAFSNAFPGTSLRLIVCNPNASAGALTFSGVDWVGGTAPTQTTTANQCDVWSFLVSGATSTAKIFGAASTGFQ